MSDRKHFIDIDRHDRATLRAILDLAAAIKRDHRAGKPDSRMAGKTLVMIFEKPSTRTRTSFQVGMQQMGGMVVVMSEQESHLGRGETIPDTARVLSRYADAIMIRTDDPGKLDDLETYASVPIINGLTDESHPCQIMADIMTFEEHRGPIEGRTIAWVGDGNNMAASWIHAATRFGFALRIGCPEALDPRSDVMQWAKANGGDISIFRDPLEAVDGAVLVNTDSWVSMGDTDAERRYALLEPYRVDAAVMAAAADDALFMHCLPAHRNEEVTDEVMDGPQSVIWDEAENRLHAQKGILAWCLA